MFITIELTALSPTESTSKKYFHKCLLWSFKKFHRNIQHSSKPVC